MPKLGIGDQDSAIRIIQATQTDPQKAIAELVENSLDDCAKSIRITRSRTGNQICLTVLDDGNGIRPNSTGEPDVESLTQNVANSEKKRRTETERRSVQGQFGIGLLGFAAIGEEMVLSSKGSAGRTRSIRLRALSTDYETDKHDEELIARGTRVEIRGVHREVQARLTAEKLQRYLSEELRDRIRASGARVTVEDKVGTKKTLIVRPHEFSGVPLRSGTCSVRTPLGELSLELYATVPKEGESTLVAIAKRGTRLLPSVLALEEFQKPPWNLNAMHGVIDFEGLSPAPATRQGFLPGKAYESLIEELRKLEPGITLELQKYREQHEERLSKEALETLKKAFAEALEELPENYDWFGDTGSEMRAEGRRRTGPGGRGSEVRVSLNGPLKEVRIAPKIAVLGLNETRRLAAKAFDPDGAVILSGVSFEWSFPQTSSSLISVRPSGAVAEVEAKAREGEATIRVKGQFRGSEAFGEAKVSVTKSESQYRFPPPSPVNAPEEPWRSRYRPDLGVLEYNSGHGDFVSAAQTGLKGRLRYLGKLYSKELVLANFAGKPASQLLEYMVQLTSALERRL